MIKHRELIPKVLGAVSPAETMIHRDAGNAMELYFGVGLHALMAIRSALLKRGLEPERIFDLPCGYGRVARFLRAAFPNAELFVSDIINDAVDFCRDHFKGTPIYTDGDFKSLLPEPLTFDLIWSGSLITHLPEDTSREFFQFLATALSETGLAVVTSHGAPIYKLLGEERHWGLKTMERVEKVKQKYEQTGYGFVEYPDRHNYGHTLISRTWISDNVQEYGLKLIEFAEGGWAGQDVVVLAKT